jgi:hypothetical protein
MSCLRQGFDMCVCQGNQRARASGTEITTHRKREFDDMVANLESKYSTTTKTKKAKKKKKKNSEAANPPSEPSEEEFLAIQKRMMAGKSAKGE